MHMSHIMRKPVYAMCKQQSHRHVFSWCGSYISDFHFKNSLHLFLELFDKATNPSPSSQIPMGQNFLFLVFENKIYMVRHSLNFWTLLSVFNEYVTRQFKVCCCGEKGTFSNTNTDFRIISMFPDKIIRYVEGTCPGYRIALPDF